MFNKKEVNELKEELTSNLANLRQEFSTKLEENQNSIKQVQEHLNILQENNQETTEKIKQDLQEINKVKTDFELSLSRIESIGRNIKETASIQLKEIANKEVESIKQSSKQFRELEEDLGSIVSNINDLNLELSKFLEISNQIKLVDFTLKSHQEDMSKTEKERMNLINENERLKMIMAKMKRNR